MGNAARMSAQSNYPFQFCQGSFFFSSFFLTRCPVLTIDAKSAVKHSADPNWRNPCK